MGGYTRKPRLSGMPLPSVICTHSPDLCRDRGKLPGPQLGGLVRKSLFICGVCVPHGLNIMH